MTAWVSSPSEAATSWLSSTRLMYSFTHSGRSTTVWASSGSSW